MYELKEYSKVIAIVITRFLAWHNVGKRVHSSPRESVGTSKL